MRSSPNIQSLESLFARWQEKIAAGEKKRTREMAAALGCTEAELVASGAGSEEVRFLPVERAEEWLRAAAGVGRSMWLLRNEATVLEADTTLSDIRRDVDHLELEGPGLSIRLRAGQCRFAFFIKTEQGPPRSLQIFDPRGGAVLKLYLKNKNRIQSFDTALAPHFLSERPEALEIANGEPSGFFGETSSAGGDPLEPAAVRSLLEEASRREETVVLSAANPGGRMTADHRPSRLVPMEDWFNILDPGFNLHLRESLLTRALLQRRESGVRCRFFRECGEPVLELELPFQPDL